ncbi:MAG TPA: ATP synthase F1 subunit gamma [Acidimicrobiales bacterium]|nr:ATP synthase F1 subunit gamma [Acidimicrobiales bacterium]
MPGGQERVLRRRIRTVKSTQKITRAFELIAASQIVRAQGRIAAAAPYQHGMAQVLAEAALDAGHHAGRLLGTPDDPQRIMLVAIVADRGLCGAYNANTLRAVERILRDPSNPGREYRLTAVGRKAQTFFRFRGVEVERSLTGFSDRPTFEDARAVADIVTPAFLAGEVDQVLVVSTRFLSAGTQSVETRQLLPLPEPAGDPGAEGAGGVDDLPAELSGRAGYTEFEPASPDLLVELVPRYTEAAIFGALLEAAASEHTARQRAMAAATDNAEDLVTTLTREMNRARQDAITTEIMEIVGGAEALRQAARSE